MTSTPPLISTARLLAALATVLVSACAGLALGPAGGHPAPGTAATAPPSAATSAAGTPADLPGSRAAAAAAPATPGAGPAAPVAAAPPPVQPYDQAVLAAAQALLDNAARPPADAAPRPPQALVIDPLIDGLTGAQSVATRAMGAQLTALIRARYPQYEVQPFSAASVARSPLVLIGTFTGVNAQRQTSGPREAFRICLALADLKTGKLVSKGLAFAQPAGVDATPLAFFRDAPVFTDDPATLGYIRTCQGTRAGDAINPLYADRIMAATLVAEATDAYDAGRYSQALALYTSAQRTPGGDQFRVYNGLYLAHWKLGHRDQAQTAFGRIVDHGLGQKRLAVKFLFQPGSTVFPANSRLSEAYPVWIKAIGAQALASSACLEVVGHTSATGPEPLNMRLSALRAAHIKSLLDASAPPLARRTIANGVGSAQTMVGNGRDDASDALDRRVEFKVIDCGQV